MKPEKSYLGIVFPRVSFSWYTGMHTCTHTHTRIHTGSHTRVFGDVNFEV